MRSGLPACSRALKGDATCIKQNWVELRQKLGSVTSLDACMLRDSCYYLLVTVIIIFVYKITYRRARAWPSGCFVLPLGRVRARAKESCIQLLFTSCHHNRLSSIMDRFLKLFLQFCRLLRRQKFLLNKVHHLCFYLRHRRLD